MKLVIWLLLSVGYGKPSGGLTLAEYDTSEECEIGRVQWEMQYPEDYTLCLPAEVM